MKVKNIYFIAMTDILCKWLNENVKLSEKIGKSLQLRTHLVLYQGCTEENYQLLFPDSVNFTKAFGSGFLLGELMSKYGLQEDFKSFSPGS